MPHALSPRRHGYTVIQIALALATVAIVATAVIYTAQRLSPKASQPSTNENTVACTADAKQCPDGSYVGRVPPSCEFAECPETNTANANITTGAWGPFVLMNDRCSKEECLFKQASEKSRYIIGAATITGYYIQREQTAWGETKRCDDFVLTGGSQTFRDNVTAHVASGNTINYVDENGRPVIHLGLKDVTPAERDRLTSSSPAAPVSLTVLKFTPRETEVGACYSIVNILRVS